MADRHTTVFGDQIDASALGAGLGKDVNDDLEVKVDDSSVEISGDALQVKALGITNAMLAGSIEDGKLLEDYIQTSEVDDATIEFAGGSLNVKNLGIDTAQLADEAVTEAKLDALDAPADAEVLSWNASSGQFEWIVPNADGVKESDVVVNEIPSGLINSSNVTFTIANTPVTGTVAVYLNGLLQAPGAGLDYTISGTTITFVKAPRTNSDLYVSYIIDN